MPTTKIRTPRSNGKSKRFGKRRRIPPPQYSLGIKLEIGDNGRVRIDGFISGSAAERDGLRTGDFLLKGNGKVLGDDPSVLSTLLQTGEVIEFEIDRDGKKQTVKVKPNPR